MASRRDATCAAHRQAVASVRDAAAAMIAPVGNPQAIPGHWVTGHDAVAVNGVRAAPPNAVGDLRIRPTACGGRRHR